MAGWHPNTLLNATRTRLIGDTGSGGLLASGSPLITAAWTRRFPIPTATATDYPYLIVYFDAIDGGANSPEAFKHEGKRMGMRVEWFCDEQSSGVDALERAGNILERVVGDWTDQSSGVPTYGLHRWTPTLQTGWSAGPMYFESAGDVSFSDGLGVIRWEALFSVEVSKARV